MLDPKYRVIVEEALREAGFDPAVRALHPSKLAAVQKASGPSDKGSAQK